MIGSLTMRMTSRALVSKKTTPPEVTHGKRRTRRAYFAVLPALLLAATAQAGTLLDVSGSGTTGQILQTNTAAGVSFGLDQSYTNVSISADLLCVNCSGEVLLMKDRIGPTATLANFVAGLSFDVSTQTSPLFTGLDLSAGDYFLILAITGATGSGGWGGSDPATVTTAAGITHGFDFHTDSLSGVVYNSNFQGILTTSSLDFSVTGIPANETPSVPEPQTWMLAIIGFGTMALRLRRRRSKSSQSALAAKPA